MSVLEESASHSDDIGTSQKLAIFKIFLYFKYAFDVLLFKIERASGHLPRRLSLDVYILI
jgi:hypothetical protein